MRDRSIVGMWTLRDYWRVRPDDEKSIGEELASWGKVALIETVGRVSGKPVQSAVGFLENDDGSLIVAAGFESADWALNLRARPACRATVGERTAAYTAAEIQGAERSQSLVALILKYGTPAERLGHGPVFRLAPRSAR
ncbi:MAG: nitroreductase family deazaflavin-dependent oxidoreductase [Chloroflexota bacterium]